MNTALMAAAMLYIGAGAKVLNHAEKLHYPFWWTTGGVSLWVLASICAVWGFASAMRERRKWSTFNEKV